MLLPSPPLRSTSDVLAFWISTLGPLGRMPKGAPGTWGSLGATLAAPWLFLPFSPLVRVLILLGILAAGIWAAQRMEQLTGRKDPGCVVVDELCGQWLTFLPFAALSPWHLLAGFALFRCFDILKPWPVRIAEKKIPSGLGMMLDDCVAALYASLALWLLLKAFSLP